MAVLQFDVAVLGAGPAGYPAAIRAAQLGKKVALIEPKELGGTCLNRGCIPSKALIAGAETLQSVQTASQFGIEVGAITFDYAAMVDRKDRVVLRLRKSLESLIKANKITIVKGYGHFTDPRTIKVTGPDSCLIQAENIIIASGSEPRNMASFPFDYERIHDSTSLLELKKLPRSLVIVGGGVIGSEFASLYSILGVEVTIVELLGRIIPMEAENVSQILTQSFIKRGIKIETEAQVTSIKRNDTGITVHLSSGKTLQADTALVAVGRSLNVDKIGLDKTGIVLSEKGLIPVDETMQTAVKGIYAVGDISSKWWLAHVATHQGLVAASNIAGKPARMHYNAIPSVIFTQPEIGTVGYSLEQAQEAGYQATKGTFPFQALGKAQAALHTEGFAQIVIDKKTGQILGAQIVGHEASSLIAEMVVAITNELTVESITESIHGHPTYAESWAEAGLLASEIPLHFLPTGKL